MSPALPGSVTGAISQSKLPSSLAALARCVEAIANCVHRLAREAVLGDALFGEHAHRLAALVGVFQAVHRHVVEQLRGAVACTPLRANIRCGALVMLSMPPATITSALPAASMSCANIIARMPEPHILRQRDRAGRLRQAGAERRLARRRLALAGHQAVAHQHFVDGVAGHAGALDRGLDRDGAELAARRALKSRPSRPPMGVRAAETMTMESGPW